MRSGFSIIELVFAIVILAITTMAIPRIVSQTMESTTYAIKQELVLNAKTLMAQILKSPWDSSYKIQGRCATETDSRRCAIGNVSPVPIYPIVNIAGGEINFGVRPGIDKIYINSERIWNSGLIAANKSDFGKKRGKENHSIGYMVEDNRYNDIDDYDRADIKGIDINLLDNSTGDFLLQTQLEVKVQFVSDSMTNTYTANLGVDNLNLSNIKLIEIEAGDMGGKDQNVTLRSYAFNIGVSFPRTNKWER